MSENQAQHTPGPWHVGTSPEDARIVYGGGRRVGFADGYTPDLQAHANARLIAAAPEMLLWLKSVVSTLEGTGFINTASQIKGVIRKAEGGDA